MSDKRPGPQTHKFADEHELASASAGFIVERAARALASRGRFNLALSGAFSALDTYRRMPEVAAAAGLDWLQVFLFWSDERCVPPDDPASHYRMVQTNLLNQVNLPDDNIHPIACEHDPKAEAERYEAMLRAHFSPETAARFDLVVLGLGAEGQLGSTYPQSMVLEDRERWVVADFVQSVGEWRVTLTPFAINQARCVLLLARGKEKSEAVSRSLQPEQMSADWPATYLRPEAGEVHWFLDEPAAVLL